MQNKSFQYGLTFGSRSNENFQDVYDEFIAADIAEAQAHLYELPESQRRGLTLKTLKHFHCGYLSKWIYPKSRAQFVCGEYTRDKLPIGDDQSVDVIKTLPQPSRRIIIPTSTKHYNAVILPADRHTTDRPKPHAGKKNELFCDADALKQDFFVVVEGEIDAMSIWQVSGGKIPVVAILSCRNWQNTLEPRLKDLRGKKIILLLDGDAAGKKASKELWDELVGRGFVTAAQFLYDALPSKLRTELFGNSTKVDANDFLTIRELGGGYLNKLCEQIVDRADFSLAKSRIKDAERLRAEYAALPDAELPAPKRGINFYSAGWGYTPAATHGNYRRGEISADARKSTSQSKNLSPEIKELADRINKEIMASDLEAKGYLQHTEKGGARPNGYVCPFCSSGTHEHRSGAFGFIPPAETTFKCQSCGKSGSVLKFLSKIYSIDNHGKDFFRLLRRAADDFNIAYDPKILERKTPTQIDSPVIDIDVVIEPAAADVTQQIDKAEDSASGNDTDFNADDTTAKPSTAEQIQAESAFVTDAAIPDDTDAKLKEWQAQFGDIDPRYMPNIKQAQEFLLNVTADNLTVDKALSLQTKNALAISKFYSYLEPLFNRFFVVIEQKKRAAVNKLQISRLDGGGLIADDTESIAWKNFSVRELKNAVAKITRAIAQTHKDFRRAEKRRIAEEQNLARQNARNEAVQRNLDELMHLRDEPPSVDRDYKLRELILDTVEWKVNHHGDRIAVNNTAANLHTIMSFDPDLCGLVGYDEFKGVNTFLRQPPWRDEPCIGDKWRNDDDALVRMFLRTHYPEFKDDKLIADAIIQYSRQYAFHEVKDFIYGLPTWDGKERLATIFIKFLGVKDTPLNRAITINWFMGLFARLFYPGCDYQICLVLPGGQRIGKSRLLRMLAGALGVNPKGKDWHISLTDSLDDSHAIDAIKNGWIIELEEGAATSKADIKAIKRFISAESDTRRFAYGKHAETVKRHCVIAITINGESFLRDTTGNARFYVLQCTKENFRQVDGMTPTYIRQCLAEGYHLFKEMFAGVKADDTYKISELLRLPLEFQVENESRNAAYMQDDGMMSQTLAWLDMKIPPQVIWNLFTREERSRFCSQGKITLPNALDDLITRRKLGSWRDQRKDIDAIRDYINDKEYCRKTEGTRTDGSDAGYTIYGSEYRQHVCPAEILNEAFAANDRRKNPARINEIFSALKGEGWIEGKTIDREPVYKRQNKVLWRSLTNVPEPAPAETENNNNDYDFGGEPIPNDDCPFDPDDLPI